MMGSVLFYCAFLFLFYSSPEADFGGREMAAMVEVLCGFLNTGVVVGTTTQHVLYTVSLVHSKHILEGTLRISGNDKF